MDAVNGLLDGVKFWHWWALAALLGGGELATGTTYLLWPMAAAAIVGLIALSPIAGGWEAQLLIFAALTTAFALAGDRFVRPLWMKSDRADVNERGRQLVGQRVIAVGDFIAGRGRVKLGDTEWSAELDGGGPSGVQIAAGAVLVIVTVDGTLLKVGRA